ncbi:MAG: queuosine precursor transporter [Flavobacteriales bacterium]|nr:queuosine precursor transporter [Flavobacteriales bacterium]
MQLSAEKQKQADLIYLILAGIFIASLVSCNLIFQKFFTWNPFGLYTFEISVGILPYPITFLVTDLISEIYGRRHADRVVMAGLVASVFVLGVVTLADMVPATDWSPVQNEEFSKVFGLTTVSVGASMAAYLAAQFIDIRLYHFWKRMTKGKHLWIRNNFSTMTSQLVDTVLVVGLLCSVGAIDWSRFTDLIIAGWLFKVIVAALDTPFMYLGTWRIRKQLGLKGSEEVEF